MTSNIPALSNIDDDDVVRTPRAAPEFNNAVVTASVDEGVQIDRPAADNALPAIDTDAVRAAPEFNNAVVTASVEGVQIDQPAGDVCIATEQLTDLAGLLPTVIEENMESIVSEKA